MTRPTALGVYIFAGGFTLGMRRHFDVLAHFEDGPFGVATVRTNQEAGRLPTFPIFTDLGNWPSADFHPQVIYGNPPCAPWSSAGHIPKQKEHFASAGITHKWEVDTRVQCVRNQFALLDKMQPAIWTWESVARAYTTGAVFVKSLVDQALALNYAVTLLRLDGAYTGLPQHRRRFFFVAHRVELPFQHPNKVPPLPEEIFREYDEAYLDVEHAESKAAWGATTREYERFMQPGMGGQDAFKAWMASGEGPQWMKEHDMVPGLNRHGGVVGRPNFLQWRLHPKQLCGTIVSGSMIMHPSKPRFLTIHETQLLSSYPSDYEFVGRDAYGQISKAVLPCVANWLGGIFAEGLDANIAAPATLRDVNYLKPL